MKIQTKEKTQCTGYFELSYIFTLDVPQEQIGKESEALTKEVTGRASYKDGTSNDEIKADLIKRFNDEQLKLNSLYGLTYDGAKWLE
jgi:hypothetical protein